MNTSTNADLARVAELFHALSDETRLGILSMLREGERCVCELQDAFNAAQSRLSYHLKILKTAGLVSDRVEGRWSYYAIEPGAMDVVREMVEELAGGGASSRFEMKRGVPRQMPVVKNTDSCCS